MERKTQKTIKKSVSIDGIGLHMGKESKLTFKPSPANTGITFVRTDIPDAEPVKPEIENLLDMTKFPRRTSIGNERFQIHTVEHLLSALYSLEIDNITIEMKGDECPGLDGSSKPFVDILKNAGIKILNSERDVFAVKEPIYVSDSGTHIIALPSDDFKVSYILDYPNTKMLSSQYASYSVTPEIYEKEISPARTFCLREEVESLRALGLGKGSDYKNTLVIDGNNGVINNELRFKDEPVRHKISDLIGDLSLFGNYISAHIIGIKSGHSMNTKLVRKLKELYSRERVSGIGTPSPSFDAYGVLYPEEISKIIPHRYPFLFIDRIIELSDNKAIGIKNVTLNEWFFQGHFPGRPVMPGVLVVEAMAQVGGVLMLSREENRGKIAYFMSIDNVKFRKAIIPGCQLILQVEVIKMKSRVGRLQGKAFVDGKIVAEAMFMSTIIDR
jgi:UDP-3-O-[3-hydroxymyristoyl] N-acetylglucosamine deacetylase / 3-hydroxyacyl-[acyl-carrier-protein] dehydratase